MIAASPIRNVALAAALAFTVPARAGAGEPEPPEAPPGEEDAAPPRVRLDGRESLLSYRDRRGAIGKRIVRFHGPIEAASRRSPSEERVP